MTSAHQDHAAITELIAGDGLETPIVLIHGFAGSAGVWPTDFFRSISGRRSCFAVSLPGHRALIRGRKNSNRLLDAGNVTHKISQALKPIGDTRVILFGHSAGGWIALRLAATYPEQIAAVVAISGFASGRLRGLLGYLQVLACRGPFAQGLARALLWMISRQAVLFRLVHRHVTTHRPTTESQELTDQYLRVARETLKQHDPDSLLSWLKMLRYDDSTKLFSEIAAPVLLVHGKDDPVVPFKSTQTIMENVGAPCKLAALPGVGHLPHLETSKLVGQNIKAWIDQL